MRWKMAAAAFALMIMAASALAELKTLPSFTLTDLKGKRLKSVDLMGEAPVLLNFWATWCKPCLAEQPKLKEFHDEWSETGFRVISISVDDPRTQKQVAPFVRRHKIEFPVYLDPNQEAIQRLGGRAVPFNVLVSSQGELLMASTGYKEDDAKEWALLIASDLEQSGNEVQSSPETGGEQSD